MVREFELPDLGEGIAEGELVEWLVEPGDEVEEDQAVAKVETDKALVEVPSPVDGTVRELRAEEGEMVPVGDVLVVFDVEGEADAAEEVDESSEEAAAEREEAADDGAVEETAATPEGRVFAAPSVRRLARELNVDIGEVEGSGPGGRVTEADVEAAAGGGDVTEEATSSSESDFTSPEGAELESSDDDAPAGIGTQASGSTGESTGEPASARGSSGAAGVESADRDRTLAAPATRRIAREKGVDIDEVPASESREGEAFVTPEAVREYAEAQQAAQEADAASLSAGESEKPERREPYRGVRRRIGESMVQSKYTAPHVSNHDDADVTELVSIREDLAERAEQQGIRLTYMPFVTKAVVAALQEFPSLNASLDEENEEIVYKQYYDVGIATDTDAGLMVPVLEDADRKGILQLASEMNELVQRARDRSIAPEELQGSTFTITNVGPVGGKYATPIINYPESGILATGEIRRQPRVVVDDETGEESIEPRDVMPISLTVDHRIVDGADAAQFTNRVVEYLENPHLLLLE